MAETTNKAVREFIAASGDENTTLVEMEHVNKENGMFPNGLTATIQKGVIRTEKDGEVKEVHAFKAISPVNAEDFGTGAKPETAINKMLRAASFGKADDWSFDVTAEWFQPPETSKRNAAEDENPWESDDAEELRKIRDDANDAFVKANLSEGNTQEAWRDFSKALEAAFHSKAIGGNARKFQAWVRGPKGAAELPMTGALTEGKNAVAEARILGRLTDEQFDLLPANLNRGKSVDKFMRDSVADHYENAAAYVASMEGDNAGFDHDESGNRVLTTAQLMEACAGALDYVVGTESDENIDIDALVEKASAAQTTLASDYISLGGKVNDTEGARSLGSKAMGGLLIVEQVKAALELDEKLKAQGDETKKKVAKERNSCAFVRRTMAAVTARENKLAKEAADARIKDAVDGAEPLKTGSDFHKKSAEQVAAQLYNTVQNHPLIAEIYSKLGVLVHDRVAQNREDERAKAEAAKEKAAAEKEKSAA